MMHRPGFLDFREFRYLKLAGGLAALAILAYWITLPTGGYAYGGSVTGYVLGIASALIVCVHLWYGLRRRFLPRTLERRRVQRRTSVNATTSHENRQSGDRRQMPAETHWRHGHSMQGWLSAHAYLGITLVVTSTLHAGFHVGWNLHTLAYLLVLAMVGTGFYGAYAYVRYPPLITAALGEDTLDDLLRRIGELDELARLRALALPNHVNTLVARAREPVSLEACPFSLFRRRRRTCHTDVAVEEIHRLGKELVSGDQPRLLRELYAVLLQKQRLLSRARAAITGQARMRYWLYLHAPLSVALLAALVAHVVVILFYW